MNMECIRIGMLNTTYVIDPHVHPSDWQVVYYFEGEGILEVGNEEIPFAPGDLVFQPPSIPHSERSQAGFRNIHMDMRIEDFPYKEPIHVRDTLDRDLYHIMMMCYNNYFRGVPGDHPLVRALLELLAQYTVMLGGVPERDERVRQMERIMIEQFSRVEFSLKEMYSTIHISDDYARALFQREMKCTPVNYLTRLRLRYACDQFRRYGKRINVQEVATKAGFQDAYYFSRLFKTHLGVCPQQWVKENCGTPGSYPLSDLPRMESRDDPV